MTSFIKKLFRGKSQEVKAAVETDKDSEPSLRFTDVVLTAPNDFGNDELGHRLQKKWMDHRGEPDATKKLLYLFVLLADVRDEALQLALRKRLPSSAPSNSFGMPSPTTAEQTSLPCNGHPSDFIITVWAALQQQFVDQFLSVDIETAVSEGTVRTVNEQTQQQTILLLETFNYLVSYPVNATSFHARSAGECAKILLLAGSSCMDEIESLEPIISDGREDAIQRAQYLWFLQVMMLEILCQLVPSRGSFLDYAGNQPWTFIGVQSLAEQARVDSFQEFFGVTVDECIIWPLSCSYGGGKPTIHQQQGEFLKLQFLEQFVEIGWFDYFFRLKKVLLRWLRNVVPAFQALENNQAARDVATYVLILQAECLHFFLSVLSERPSLLPTFLDSQFSAKELCSTLRHLSSTNSTYFKLILRNMILLIRINSFISTMRETEITCLSLFELSSKEVSSLLVDINRRVATVARSLGISSTQREEMKVVFEYFGKVGQVQVAHDLWPWNHDSAFVGSLLMATASAQDFHIVPPESLMMLKKLIHKHPVYLLWDNLISEVLGSTMLSESKPMQHKSSRVQPEKVHFLFEVFHELFHNIPLLEQCASSTFFPFLQIKYVDFISDLFKAAETSTIFSILTEFDTFRLLLGDYFLLAHKEIFHLGRQIFQQVSRDEPERDRHKLVFAQYREGISDSSLGWIFLHDTVMDYFHGLVIYSLYFLNSMDSVVAFRSYDDIMLVLLQYMHALLQMGDDQAPHDVIYEIAKLLINLNDIVVSMVLTSNKTSRDKIIFGIIECIELAFRPSSTSVTLKTPSQDTASSAVGLNLDVSSDAPRTSSSSLPSPSRKGSANQSDFEHDTRKWMKRASTSALVELFINIVLSNARRDHDWIDAFHMRLDHVMVDFASEMLRLSKGKRLCSLAPVAGDDTTDNTTGSISPRGARSNASSLRKQTSSTSLVSFATPDVVPAGASSGSGGTSTVSLEKPHRIRNSIAPIFYLLMDEHHHLAALQIIQTLVLACAHTINAFDAAATITSSSGNGSNSGSASASTATSTATAAASTATTGSSTSTTESYQEIQAKKQSLRALAGEAILVILGFMGVAHKHADPLGASHLSLHAMNTIMVLLRDDAMTSIRITVQEIIRREKLLYEMLRAIARSLNGFDALRQKKDPLFIPSNAVVNDATNKWNPNYVLSALLRTSLSLTAAISAGNDLCKSEINHLVQGNREKIVSSRIKLVPSSMAATSSSSASTSSASGSSSNNGVPSIATNASANAKSATGLASLILCAERLPQVETITVLFDLLLDGPFGGQSFLYDPESSKGLFRGDDDRPRLKNAAILNDLMHLVPFCSLDVQKFALSSLLGLISGRASLINLNVCSSLRPKLIDSALDLFPFIPDAVQSLNAELIELLGRNNISVASLKHLFRVLQYTEGERPQYAWKIVQSLQGMYLQEVGPKHTFVFTGFQSGLKLPPIHKWPTLKGFAFCGWIKLESPKLVFGNSPAAAAGAVEVDDNTTEVYQPQVFCFRHPVSNAGIEFGLKQSNVLGKYRLIIQSYTESGERCTYSSSSDDLRLDEGKWYFIGVSLSPSKFYGKGETLLCVGNNFDSHVFNFAKLPDQIMEPTIGGSPAAFALPHHHHTLRGQMGAMYFFHEALPRAHFQLIQSLGPDYLYNFEPISYQDRSALAGGSGKGKNKVSLLEEAQLNKKILLSYNPVVLRGKYFLDNTPDRNDIKWKLVAGVSSSSSSSSSSSAASAAGAGGRSISSLPAHGGEDGSLEIADEVRSENNKYILMHALKLPGTYRSTYQDVRLAINSLGGIRAIIPLFALVDKTVVPTNLNTVATVSSQALGRNTTMYYEANFFPAVLGLFNTMIADGRSNMQVFQKSGGFAAIRTLLERSAAENFNLITFNQFVALYSCLQEEYLLQDSLLENILCNFKLWFRSACDVQLALFDWLIGVYQYDGNCNPLALSAQRLIDTCYQYLDYEPAQVVRELYQQSSTMSGASTNAAPSPSTSLPTDSSLPLPPPPASASPSSSKPSGATATSAASVASAGSANIQLPSGTQIESLSAHVSLHRDPQHPFFDPTKLASIRAKVFKLIEISFHKRSASLFEDIAALIRYASMVSTHAARAEVLQLLIRLLRDADLQKKLPSMLIGFVFGHALVQLDAIFLQGDMQTKGLVLYLVGLFLQELHKSWADTVGLCLQLHGEITSIHSHWTKSLSSEDPHGATSTANRPHAGSHDHSHPSPRRGFTSPSASTAGTAAPIHPKFHVRLDKHMAVSNTVEFVEKSGIAYGVTSLILTVSQYFRQLPEGQEPFVPFSIFYDFLMDIMYGRATLTLWRYLQERQFVTVARSGFASGGQSPAMHETHASSTPSGSSTRVFYSFVYFPLLRVTAAGQASSAEKVHQLKHLETLACNPHVHQQLMATEDWQSQLLHGLSSFFTSIASSPSYLSHVVSTLATNGTTEATVLQPSYLQGSEADADIELLTLCVRIYTYFVRSLFKRWQTRLKASISPGRTPSPKPEPTHYFMRHHSTAAVPHEPPVEDVRASEWGAAAGANANGIQAQHKEIVDYRNMLAMADALPQYALQQFFVLTTLFIGVTCAREMHVEYSRRAGAAAASGPFSIARLEFVYCVGVLLQEYVERVQSRLVIVTPAAQRERAKSSADTSNEDGSSSREDVIRTLHISYGWIAWFYAYHHRSEYQQESIIFLLQCFLDPVTMQVASLSSSSSSSPSSSSLVNTTNMMSANTVLGSFEERMESLRNDMCFSGILKLSSASSTSNVYYASDFAMARDSLFASPSASGVMASTSTASSRMAFDVTWQGIRCVAHLLKSVSPYPHRTQWCFSMLHTLFRMMVNMMLNETADDNDGEDITTITSLTGLGIFEILHIVCLVFQLMFEGHFTRGNVAVDVASNGAEYDAMVHDVFQYLRVWCDSTLFSLVGGAASSSGRSPRSEKSLKVRTYLMRFVSIGEEVIRAEANGSSAGLVQQLVTIVEDGAVNILTELMEDVIAPSNWDYFLRYMQEDNTNLNTSAISIPPPSPASSPSLTTGSVGGETSRRASVTNLASLLALSSGDMAADAAISPEKNALLAQFLTDIVWAKTSSGATASLSASPRGTATYGQQLRSMMVVVDMVLQAARFMENEVCSMQIMESGFGDVLVDDSMLAGVPTAAAAASRTAGATKASPAASADHLLEPTTPRGAVGTSTAAIDDDATVVADKLPANYHLLQEQALLDHATLNSTCKDNVVGALVPNIDSAAIINDEEDRYIHDCNVQVMSLLLQSEAHRLLDHFRITETNYKRCESKWTRIFSQLANERGPWGYGNEQHREVFWTLDHVLNSTHVKFRLRRNPFGSNHTIATKKSAGGSTPVGGSNNAAVMYTADEGDDDDADAKNRMGIYADLKRFKKSTIPSLDRGYDNTTGDNGNDDEDEDEGAAAVNGPSTSSGRGHSTAPDTTATAVATNDGFTVTVEVISVATNPSGGRTHGRLEISRHKLCFFRSQEYKEYDFINKSGNPEFLWACMAYPSTVWMAHDVTEVYRRRYQQRYVALEIFFANRTSVFINCFDKSTAKKVYTYLVSAKFRANAKYMSNLFTGNATSAIARITWGQGLTLTQAWVLRKISNFEYLMYLNFIAGRSFNDLAQYPVFPWILADYSSAKLDFKNPNTFRRLDLPIAAQLESQQRVLRDKYESSMELGDPDILPYHSGSHYSTSAMVLWYLLRMEPFTSLHVWLQEGRFDRPDRLFDSIERAYRGCTTNPQDVKELIPEFFFNPEFLSNVHHLDFGRKQDGQAIGDVELPRWCKDPADFVRQHREALESEYVSLHLHHWIDLIFGVKQRPPFLPGGSDKSVDAMNVFVHLSYADAVDLDGMRDTDPALYQRTIRQIDCYGQTPIQLFTKDHPPRKRLDEVHDLFWPIASIVPGADVYASSSHSSRHGKGDRDDPSGSSSASAGASSSSMSMTLSSSPSNASSSTAALTSAASGAGSSNAAFEIDVYLDKPSKILCYGEFRLSHHPILFVDVQTSIERLITIDSGRILGNHAFQMRLPDNVPPYALKVDKSVTVSSHSGSGSGHGTGHGSSASSGSSSSSSGTTSSLTSFMMPGMNNREKVLGIPFAAPVVLSSTVLDRADATKYDWYEQAGELVGSRRNRSHYLDEESKAVRGLLYSSSGSPSSTGGSNSANGGGRSRSGTTTSMRAGSSSSSKSVTPPRSGSGKGATSSSASSANTSTFFAASSTAATSSSSSSSKASITAKMKQLSDQDLMNEVIESSSGRQATSASHHTTSSGKTTLSASSLSSTSAASASAAAAAAAAAAVTHRRDRVDEHLSSQLFSVLLVSTSATATATSMVKFVFSCGHWDNTFKVTSLESGKLLQSIAYHREVVTCIAAASDYGKSWVIAGSKDCTLTVWEVYDRESDPVSSAPLHTLYGHDDAINCLCVKASLDLIVSGSDDGTIILHSLREGVYLRSIAFGVMPSLTPNATASSGDDAASSVSSSSSTATTAATAGSASSGGASSRSGRPMSSPSTPLTRKSGAASTPSPLQSSTSMNLRNNQTQSQAFSRSRSSTLRGGAATANASSTATNGADGAATDWSLTTVVGLNTSIASMQKVTKRVHMIQVTGEGHIVAYSHDFTLLAVYTLNGRFIRMISTRERLYALLVSDDSRVVLTGGERGLIVLRWLHNLSIANNGCRRGLEFVIDGSTDKGMEPFPSPIRCMTFTEKERHLIVGLESGEIRVLAQDSEYLQRKLHRRLMEIGILPT